MEFMPELKTLQKAEPVVAKPEGEVTNPPAEGVVTPPEKKPEPLDKDKAQERIDELTRKAKTAEETAEAYRLENERLKAGGGEKKPEAPTAQAAGILDDVHTAAEVQGRIETAHKVIALAKRHFRHGESVFVEDEKAEGGKRELTPEVIQQMENEAEEILRNAPGRLAFLQNREVQDAAAREILPEFFEAGSTEAKSLEQMRAAVPQLASFEDSTAATIALMIGFKEIARRRAEKAKATGAAPAEGAAPKKPEAKLPGGKVPLAPPAPGASTAPRVDAEELKQGEAKKALLASSGSQADLEKFYGA